MENMENNKPAPSQYDVENLSRILNGEGDWYGAMLLRLIAKADGSNRELLRQVYPNHVEVLENYFGK